MAAIAVPRQRVAGRRHSTHEFTRRCLAHAGIQPECRVQSDQRLAVRLLDKEQQHDHKRQHPADIAKGEPGPREITHLFRRAKRRQLRVDEDQRIFRTDETKTKGQQPPPKVRPVGHGPPDCRGPGHIHHGKHNDPRQPPPRRIGKGAHDRCAESDDQPRYRQAPGPHRLRPRIGDLFAQTRGHEMVRGDRCKIRPENERHQQRVIRLACPVEKEPAPDALALRYFRHACPFASRAI